MTDTKKHEYDRDRLQRVKDFVAGYGSVFNDENVIAEIRGGGRIKQLRLDDLSAIIKDATDSWSAASSMNGDVTKFAHDLKEANAEIARLRAEVKEFHEYLREDHNRQAFRGWQILKAKVQALKGGAQ
ncbi:hypothetical protein ACTU44_11920 [Thalassospira sp. SM2505]